MYTMLDAQHEIHRDDGINCTPAVPVLLENSPVPPYGGAHNQMQMPAIEELLQARAFVSDWASVC